jgi:hypothetical protein
MRVSAADKLAGYGSDSSPDVCTHAMCLVRTDLLGLTRRTCKSRQGARTVVPPGSGLTSAIPHSGTDHQDRRDRERRSSSKAIDVRFPRQRCSPDRQRVTHESQLSTRGSKQLTKSPDPEKNLRYISDGIWDGASLAASCLCTSS